MEYPYHSICVFCASADGLDQVYYDAAMEMGKQLALKKIRLVYGAGRTGLMGVLAQSVLQNDGDVIGISPKNFDIPQLIMSSGLTKLEIVEDMQIRKARMIELADAFIALPGGFGTADELFEVLTLSQIGLQKKPIGILNTNGFFDSLLTWIDRAYRDRFIYEEHRQLFMSDTNAEGLLEKLTKFQFPDNIGRWVIRDN